MKKVQNRTINIFSGKSGISALISNYSAARKGGQKVKFTHVHNVTAASLARLQKFSDNYQPVYTSIMFEDGVMNVFTSWDDLKHCNGSLMSAADYKKELNYVPAYPVKG